MPTKDLHIIDPYLISDKDCPVFIQAGDMRSFFGWGIRARTKSNFNHSMIMRLPGKVCTQSWTYKEIDISEYMKPGQILKFWICKDITNAERNAIMIKIAFELKRPWYKKMYDVPGIFGQLFGLRWVNIPSLNYCSERVRKLVEVLLPVSQKHPTPEDLDTLYKESPRMGILGYWIGGI